MLSLIKDLIVKKTAKVAANNNNVVKKKKIGRPAGNSKIQQMLELKEAELLMEAVDEFETAFNKLKTILNKALYK